MAVAAHQSPYPLKQRVQMPPLVIIEFVLDQLPHSGTAGQLLHLSLAQSYIAAPERLHHELIFFDIGDAQKGREHDKRVVQIVGNLQKRYAAITFFSYLANSQTTGDLIMPLSS
jgi:hypothetical protein